MYEVSRALYEMNRALYEVSEVQVRVSITAPAYVADAPETSLSRLQCNLLQYRTLSHRTIGLGRGQYVSRTALELLLPPPASVIGERYLAFYSI